MLQPVEIKNSAQPEKKMTAAFSLIDKSPLKKGTGAVLCLCESLGAFDENTLIVPVTYI